MGREQRLSPKMTETIGVLHQELLNLDLSHLPLSDYGIKYFQRKKSSLVYELELYGYAIQKAGTLEENPGCMIEFGGGLGFGSILAYRFHNDLPIHYMDIDPEITKDASVISAALGIEGIFYQNALSTSTKLPQNAVLFSKDVIEHVYDLKKLFADLSKSQIRSVHLTTANPKNIFRKKYFQQIHQNAERKNSKSNKTGQSKLGYFQERLNNIIERYPEMSLEEQHRLAEKSKGLIFNDIALELLNQFGNKNTTKVKSNTCDPKSGNWAERLLYVEEYKALAKDTNLKHQVYGLPYDIKKPKLHKNLISRLLNMLLTLCAYRCNQLVTTQMHVLTPNQE